jgi:triacylglycerol lipase
VFSSLAPARRRLVIVLLAVVIIAAISVTATVIARRATGTSPVASDVPGPVLLVPGYGGSTSSLQPLATALTAAGKQVHIIELPDNAQGDLNAQAEALAAQAKAVLSQSKAASVDVVGYSAGGVVTRLWVRDHGGAGLVRRVVTLGSPQHGTQLASLGSLVPGACPVACQQLAADSQLLDGLNAGDETPAGPAWVSVWTTSDDVVLPPDSAQLAGALNLTVQSLCATDRVTHSGLPGDAVVRRIVIAALGVTLAQAAPGC